MKIRGILKQNPKPGTNEVEDDPIIGKVVFSRVGWVNLGESNNMIVLIFLISNMAG